MGRTVAIGIQDFKDVIQKNCFYIDKTDFIREWWELNYLDTGRFDTYWANTSANSLVSRLLRESGRKTKEKFELLMRGEILKTEIDEQVVYDQLSNNEDAVWSLLTASGYLKVVRPGGYQVSENGYEQTDYELAITNLEVYLMFKTMVKGWFKKDSADYNDFVVALLRGDVRAMNVYMNRVALSTFSYFDTGSRPSGTEPERFYHGFVLGLLVELSGRYQVTSNRESGFGRYDVLLEPLHREDDAIILEFKVKDDTEKYLSDTVNDALRQIEDKRYAQQLCDRGIPRNRIRQYGFAFEGKNVLIG